MGRKACWKEIAAFLRESQEPGLALQEAQPGRVVVLILEEERKQM